MARERFGNVPEKWLSVRGFRSVGVQSDAGVVHAGIVGAIVYSLEVQ